MQTNRFVAVSQFDLPQRVRGPHTFHSELELAIRESYFATNCPPLTQPSGCSHVGKNNNALAAALTGVLVCV